MGELNVRSCPLAEAVSPLPLRSKIKAGLLSPLPAQSKIKAAEVFRVSQSQTDPCPPDEEKMATLSLAVRCGLKAEVALYLAARSSLKAEELEKVYFFAFEDGPEVEELRKVFCDAVDGELTSEEILSLAHQSGVTDKEVMMIISVAIRVGLYSNVDELITFASRSRRWDALRDALYAASLSEEVVGLAIQAALQSGMTVEQILFLVKQNNYNADLACHILVQSGIQADVVLSAAVHTRLKAKEEVHAILLEELLASFDTRTTDDPELDEWERPPKPHYYITEQRSDPRQDPRCPFFLFKMKASAKKAQVSWWMKKYSRFPPERPKYKYAMRVARLDTRTDGFHVNQAGEGGQPGALSFYIPSSWYHPNKGIFKKGSSVPIREVAVIKRLPGGDGISIMSYVYGLGVMLRDILFVLHCPSATVALSFTERSFYVSSKFTGIPLYARADLDFIDITGPVEKLIKKLYQLYQQEQQEEKVMHEKEDHRGSQELVCQREEQEHQEKKVMDEKEDHQGSQELVCQREEQEQQEKKVMHEKEDHQGSQELVCQREEQEQQEKRFMHEKEDYQGSQELVCQREKQERKRREEIEKCRVIRKEMKKVVQQMKAAARTSEEEEQHEEYDPMLLPIFLIPEECDLVKPSEELCQREKRHDELLAEVEEHYDLLNLGGGGSK